MYLRSSILSFLAFLAPFQTPADSFRKHYETAEAERRAGHLVAAEAEFTAILGEAFRELGRVYTAEGNYKEAVATLESAATYQAGSPDLLVDLAIACFHVDDYRKAEATLAKAIAVAPRSAAAHHMMGKTLFMLSEFDRAVVELQTAQRLAPTDYDVTYTLGLAYLKQNRFAAAKRVFDRLVVRLGDRPQLRVLIGRAYRETGFLDEAIGEFRKAIALDPHFSRVHYYLGLTFLLKDGAARIEDAKREFRVELADHPDEYFANYYLGVLANMERQWDVAAPFLQKAVTIQPTNPDPYFYLGQVYQGLQNHELAVEALTRSIALTPDVAHNDFQVATAHYCLGQSLLKLGRTDEGARELQTSADLKSKSLKSDEKKAQTYLGIAGADERTLPDAVAEQAAAAASSSDPKVTDELKAKAEYFAKVVAAAHNNIGLLRASQQDFAAAAEHFGLAAKWNPEQEGLYFNLGLADFKAERYKDAISPLETEVNLHPGNSAAKHFLGLSYFMVQDYANACSTLGDAVAARPDDAELYYPLALALAKEGRTEASNRVIQRMVEFGDQSPQVHILLGQAYAQHGEIDKAREELHAALAIEPKTPLAHFYLGMIEVTSGKLDDAAREFESELALNPNDVQARYHLGYVLLARRDTARGIQTMREVIKAKPDYADARYELGKALLEQADIAGAVENLELAATIDPDKAHIQYQLGRAYVAAGRQAEGEIHLDLAKRLKEKERAESGH